MGTRSDAAKTAKKAAGACADAPFPRQHQRTARATLRMLAGPLHFASSVGNGYITGEVLERPAGARRTRMAVGDHGNLSEVSTKHRFRVRSQSRVRAELTRALQTHGSAVCTGTERVAARAGPIRWRGKRHHSGTAPGRGPTLPGGVVMAIRPNSEERSFGADRERQREVSNESGRSARSSNDESSADDTSENGSARTRSNRGFASMDRSKQREIASKGGRAAHQKGTAHEFDSSEARAAGRKGGVTVSKNREHMAAIGRRGGEARGANRAARMQQGSQSPPGTQRFPSDRRAHL